MTPTDLICTELRNMGLAPHIISANGFIQNTAVALSHQVPTGRFKDQTFALAIGFQEDTYPDYPPHFIYVAELPSTRLPVHSSFDYDNRHWKAFSVPPSDFWDNLPASEKNMKTFLNRHLLRFWSQI